MSQNHDKSPDDQEWKSRIEQRMSDYEAAMVGDFKNPQGMMQNMLRVMNTLYHDSEGVIARHAALDKKLQDKVEKYDRLIYIGMGVVIAINVLPTLVGWIQALMKVKP